MIASLGDAVVDLVAVNLESLPAWGEDRIVPRISQQLGGAALNFAVNLAALRNNVALLAGIGDDEWAGFLQWGAAAGGVRTEGMKRLDAPTAVTMVLSSAQDRAFVSVYGATAAFGPQDIDATVLGKATHLHISGLWQSDALRPHLTKICAEVQARGGTVSLDTGYDATDSWGEPLPNLLAHVNVFFPNEVEAVRISRQANLDDALTWLAERVSLVALKLGEEGARVRQGQQEWSHPAFPVEVVDTTGAGDAFNAGFLQGWLMGWPMEKTLQFANATGALAVTRIGGGENAPTLETIEEFIAQHAPARVE